MKTVLYTLTLIYVWLMCLCTVMMDEPETAKPNDPPSNPRVARKIGGLFPFEDNSNAWYYTESGGNTVRILVTDTISDDGVIYYRVSFRENRVDTTDDWFQRSTMGIYFGQSLAGKYNLFLPAKIDSVSGSFVSGGPMADYTYYDSLLVNGTLFHNVLRLRYDAPLIHGFDVLTLADSVGIVELIDHHGRWPISYEIDSCSISGIIRKF